MVHLYIGKDEICLFNRQMKSGLTTGKNDIASKPEKKQTGCNWVLNIFWCNLLLFVIVKLKSYGKEL